MPIDAPEITGSLWEVSDLGEHFREWFDASSTGEEYEITFATRARWATLWGIFAEARPDEGVAEGPASEADEMRRLALAIAAESPYVSADRPEVPELTDNLVSDVRATTGLTYAAIAGLFGISERAVAAWRERNEVPRHRRALLQALRSLGLLLVGGLGVDGVAEWLEAGSPPRLARLADGDLENVLDEARGYEYSPAT